MSLNKITPILIVDAIEPSLGFWERRLGFSRAVEVPFEGRLGFVLLSRDGQEVMLQSRGSIEDDLGILAQTSRAAACVLYLDVPDLEPIKEALSGVEVAVGERTTSYGAREIYYREPGGHVIGFAARKPQQGEEEA